MLTGRKPFTGDDVSTTLARVIEREPDFRILPSSTPPHLRRLLVRCFEKDPKRRLRDIGDARADLNDALSRDTGFAEGSGSGSRSALWQQPSAILAVVLVAGLVGYLLWVPSGDVSRVAVPRFVNVTQVTSALGIEYPALSPDAEWLAYASDESGELDVWVLQLGAGQAINRTSELAGEASWPTWSPDGRRIAFVLSRPGEQGIWVMDAVAGGPRRVVAGDGQFPCWSADGSRIGYVVSESEGDGQRFFIEILDVSSGEAHRLPTPTVATALAWSPDGQLFAYVGAPSRGSTEHRIWLLRVNDGTVVSVTDAQTDNWGPSFSPDASSLFYSSNQGGTYDLWQQRLDESGAPEGRPRQMTSGMEIRYTAQARNVGTLAVVKGRHVANLWRVGIVADWPGTWSDAQQLTFDRAWTEGFSLSADRQSLSLSTNRSGNWDVWILPVSGGSLNQLTIGQTSEYLPDWSPDGQQILFHGTQRGNRDIWVIPASGGPATALTDDEAEDSHPSWSPDGRSIVFRSGRGGASGIWMMSANGEDERELTTGSGTHALPVWAPDGQSVVYYGRSEEADGWWQVSVQGGSPTLLIPTSQTDRATLSPDGAVLYFA